MASIRGSSSEILRGVNALRDEPADPVVQRRVELDDVRHLREALGEDVEHLGRKRRRRRLQRAGRREGPVILEDGENVLVAGHHPEVERRDVEDGLLAPREREDVERVLPLLGRRRVERDGRVGGHDERAGVCQL